MNVDKLSQTQRDGLALNAIMAEVQGARLKHPNWPTNNLLEATAIVCEESGEALREALQITQGEHGDEKALREEIIQTAAVCIRFLSES